MGRVHEISIYSDCHSCLSVVLVLGGFGGTGTGSPCELELSLPTVARGEKTAIEQGYVYTGGKEKQRGD